MNIFEKALGFLKAHKEKIVKYSIILVGSALGSVILGKLAPDEPFPQEPAEIHEELPSLK